ncbi:TPA: GspH/FimT family protein [Stenotrophomonas maltophilia]|nr:GspH/FimT family protein [Stenotrophomonas maltophilia]HDS1043101.1 GspH/FimT family protein [Stenotrophomonas maltophilia]
MNRTPAAGHALAELMVVLLVLAVLASIAHAPFSALLGRLRADQLRMQLHGALHVARSTALDQRRTMVICPTGDGQHCGQDWAQGWMLLAESAAGSGDFKGPPVLHRALDSHRSMSAVGSDGRPRITYRANGRSAGSNARIRVCQHDMRQAEIIVSNSGRVRSLRTPEDTPC